MGGEVDAAAFFGCLDEQNAACQRHLLGLQRGDGRERAEYRIAVIGAPTAVEFAVADDRFPRPEAWEPAGELRLLVEMSVEQHAAGKLAGNVDDQERRQTGQAPDLDPHARNRLGAAPVGHQIHGGIHVAVLLPLRIEHPGFVGNADVRLQPLDDRLVPDTPHELVQS